MFDALARVLRGLRARVRAALGLQLEGPGAYEPGPLVEPMWQTGLLDPPLSYDAARTLVDRWIRSGKEGLLVGYPLDVVIHASLPRDMLGAWARYGRQATFLGDQVYSWADLCEGGNLPIVVSVEALTSEEAAVAVLTHELWEIQRLRAEFSKQGKLTGRRLVELVRASGRLDNGADNLHAEAWAVSDYYVEHMRGKR